MNQSTASMRFIIPTSISQTSSMVHSSCYRLSMNILSRSESDPVAIPVEKLSLQAIISENKIWFAAQPNSTETSSDSIPIKISWEFFVAEARDDNSQHLPMNITFYEENLNQLQQKLTGEFYKALMLVDEKYRDAAIPAATIEITPDIE